MYRVATFLLDTWWGKFGEMADALSVMLLTWNQAFYRYGLFDPKRLETCLDKQWAAIESFRTRDIMTLGPHDHESVKILFNDMLPALATTHGVSPVAVGKCLHLLAPSFFPIWDMKIAKAYGCRYNRDPANAYVRFCEINKEIVEALGAISAHPRKTLLKRIDEYNYVHFSKGWV